MAGPYNLVVEVGNIAYGAGKFFGGMEFGVPTYVGHFIGPSNGVPFNMTSGSPFGISFWMLYPAIPGGPIVFFYEGIEFYFLVNAPTGFAEYAIPSGGSITGNSNVCDNNPHLIYLDYDGTSLRLYVDGTLETTVAKVTVFSGGGVCGVGGHFNGTNTYDPTGGWIDELAVFTASRHTGSTYTPETVQFLPNTANMQDLYHFYNNGTDSAGLPILAQSGNIIVSDVGIGDVQLYAPYTGGIPPLSYAYYKSTTPGFTPGGGNVLSDGGGISGSTTALLTDATTLTANTSYWYAAAVTDSDTTTFTTPLRLVRKAASPAIKLAIIGDSTSTNIAGNGAAADFAYQVLINELGVRQVTLENGAIGGTTAAQWSSNSYSGYTTLLAACGGSFTGWLVIIRLGVNDAQLGTAAATVAGYYSDIATNVIANGGIPLFSFPLGREAGLYGQDGVTVFNDSVQPLVVQYIAALVALINNTTIFPCDLTSNYVFTELPQNLYYYVPGTYETTPGAIHPSTDGAAMMGAAEAFAIYSYLGLASVGTPVSVSHGGFFG